MIRILSLVFILAAAGIVSGQQAATTPAAGQSQPAAAGQPELKLADFQNAIVESLQRQFPRMPGIFASAHSCKLPDYGPMVTVIIQPPAFFFTRPMLQELERQQKMAEIQAQRIRSQIDHAAQLIQLKAREAELQSQLDAEYSTKKGARTRVNDLQRTLTEVRHSIDDIEKNPQVLPAESEQDQVVEVDLDKLLNANYQALIERVTAATREALAENAPLLKELKKTDRLSIAAHIRENLMTNQEQTILFMLPETDIEAFRHGTINFEQLKAKVIIQKSEE